MPVDLRPLVTVRPGPVLHVWRGGQEVAAIPLTTPAALSLLADLAATLMKAKGGAP